MTTLRQLEAALQNAETARMNGRPFTPPTEADFPGLERLTEVAREVLGIEPPLRWADESTGRIGARLRRLDLDPDSLGVAEAADAIEASRDLEPLRCLAGDHEMPDSELDNSACYACRQAARERHLQTMGHLFSIPKALKSKDAYALMVLLQSLDETMRDTAIEFFGDRKFTMETWEALSRWLHVRKKLSWKKIYGLTQAEVCAMLAAELERANPGPSAIVAKRKYLNLALGVSPNYPNHLEKMHQAGELTLERRKSGKRDLFAVILKDPLKHAEVKEKVRIMQSP
jgi:hypothetical protein